MRKIIVFLTAFLLFFTLNSCKKKVEYESLESKSLTLYVGETGKFAEGYQYSTLDTEIIELYNNQYRTLKEGSAVVTVNDGDYKIGVYLIAVYGKEVITLQDLEIKDKPANFSKLTPIKLDYKTVPENANNYDAIVWESLNPEVATVDKHGNVNPLTMGEVTIKLTAVNANVSKEFKFNVLPRETVFKTSHSKILGYVGKTEKILETVILTDLSFDGNVTWFSENEEIVTVAQDGTTTFVAPGTANVGIKGTIDGKEVTYKAEVVVVEDQGYTIIRTPLDLQNIGNQSGYYMLGNDIDMAPAVSEGGKLYNDGKGFMPLFEDAKHAFEGVFDGNGFTIYNMYINRPDDVFIAFMRYISSEEGKEGLIKRLSFVGGSITGGNYTSVFYANASGYGSKESGVRDAYVEMTLKSVGSLSLLVGNNKGMVENCIVNVEYEAAGDAYLFALNHTGLERGLGIKNCVFIGDAGELEWANLENGGSVSKLKKITKEDIATFEFAMGDNWTWEKGSLPKVKGVTYEQE